jgi:hypothetical protein
MVPVFQDWWFNFRQGGFEQCYQDFVDEEKFMDEVHEFWMEWALAYLRNAAFEKNCSNGQKRLGHLWNHTHGRSQSNSSDLKQD